jgi:hypothetical protein
MKLPPGVEFHEDIRLFIHKPRGLLNKAIINKVVWALGDLEAKLQEPFNRFADTSAADDVDLNFKYIIQVSLHRRVSYAGRPPVKSAILATDSPCVRLPRYSQLAPEIISFMICRPVACNGPMPLPGRNHIPLS